MKLAPHVDFKRRKSLAVELRHLNIIAVHGTSILYKFVLLD
jgi:hypothetical protein